MDFLDEEREFSISRLAGSLGSLRGVGDWRCHSAALAYGQMGMVQVAMRLNPVNV